MLTWYTGASERIAEEFQIEESRLESMILTEYECDLIRWEGEGGFCQPERD